MSRLINLSKYIFVRCVAAVTKNIKNFLYTTNDRSKRFTPNEEALKKALQQCSKEVKKSKRWKVMLSLKCFEHAPMLSRKAKSYHNKIAICQMYISLVDECLTRPAFSKKRFERKVRTLCKPFVTRILDAKNLDKNNGVEVHYF